MARTTIVKYLHGDNENLEDLWDYDAPQQDKAHYWLYEIPVVLDVDLDTGDALITHVCGVELKEPVKA